MIEIKTMDNDIDIGGRDRKKTRSQTKEINQIRY